MNVIRVQFKPKKEALEVREPSEHDLIEINLMEQYMDKNLSDDEWEDLCGKATGKNFKKAGTVKKNIAYKEQDLPMSYTAKEPELTETQKSMKRMLSSIGEGAQQRLQQILGV